MKKIFNPFQNFSEKQLVLFGSIITIIATALAVLLNGRFDGVLDLHFVEKTTIAKEKIIQNTDTKFQSLTEQVNSSKENLSKTVSEKFSEQAAQSKSSFENLSNSLKESISQVNLRQDKQDKEIKTLKTILFIICGLIIIGTVATILVLK